MARSVRGDLLLLSILAGQESDSLLTARSNGVATTLCWFYRLSRAIAPNMNRTRKSCLSQTQLAANDKVRAASR